MAKSHDTRKDVKKKAEKTLKEKRREKKAKKQASINKQDLGKHGSRIFILNTLHNIK